MGDGKKDMKNLDNDNIYRDEGKVELDILINIENEYKIQFPSIYSNFITQHNGARLNVDSFDFYDEDIEDENSASIAFIQVQKISKFIKGLLAESINDPDYFPKKLIPFGDDGGGNYMCFDYRNHSGDNPPVVFWNHDVYENSKRISFVANNFEDFINMLHKSEYVD